MRRRFAIVNLMLTAAVFLTSAVSAHDFHTTFMTINQDLEKNNLEITLKVFTHDLVPTLERRLNKNVDLGTDGINPEIETYITEGFSMTAKDGSPLKPVWVGKEVDAQVAYIYFEIPFEGDLEGSTIANTLFFERYPEQVNYVSISFADKKSDLVFKTSDSKAQTVIGREKDAPKPVASGADIR